MSPSPKIVERIAHIDTSDLIDVYYANCVESILSSADVCREFIRGGGISEDTIAERAWSLAAAMMRCRTRNYHPTEFR